MRTTLIVIAGIVFAVAALAGASYLYLNLTKELDVTDGDRAVLVGADVLIDYFSDYAPAPGAEVVRKLRYLDGTYEIDLEYDVPDDPEQPFLSTTVNIERTLKDAFVMFEMSWNGTRLGLNVYDTDLGLREDNDFFSYGDRSRHAFIVFENEPAGNLFASQINKKVFVFMISGFYFDDSEAFADLLLPRLEELRDYRP
jgi:hypothetical protein